LTRDGGSFTKGEPFTKGEAMAKKKTKGKGRLPFSERFKQAIDGSGLTRYRIAKDSGVAQSTISQFMNGKRSLSLKAVDRIAEVIDLEFISKQPQEQSEG
jgi:predicted transcriptional regulator